MDIVERAKAITLNPAATWPVIEAEPHTPQSLFVPYMLVLAAIPAVATFIGMSVVGFGAMGFSMRMPVLSGLSMMVTSYVLSLAMTFALGWLVSALAPTFGGQASLIQGLKLVVFGTTPVMLAGILGILPALGMLSLLAALYCLYLLYLGLPVLMKNPQEKTIPYMVVVALCGIVMGVVIGAITSAFTPSHGGMRMGGAMPGEMKISTPQGNAIITTTPGVAGIAGVPGTADTASIVVKTPDGEIKVDVKQMEALAKQMEELAAQMEKNKK